ncbi:MAG: hypothetical protein KME08_12110 [Aphanothece sp. CMT-3BRIN-NPC111]|nr:hypothetical protein [Aphanothece sp. CMT-3BRIN-NPC111]
MPDFHSQLMGCLNHVYFITNTLGFEPKRIGDSGEIESAESPWGYIDPQNPNTLNNGND